MAGALAEPACDMDVVVVLSAERWSSTLCQSSRRDYSMITNRHFTSGIKSLFYATSIQMIPYRVRLLSRYTQILFHKDHGLPWSVVPSCRLEQIALVD